MPIPVWGWTLPGTEVQVTFGQQKHSAKAGADGCFDVNGLMLANKEGYEPPVPTPDASIPWLSIQAKDETWHWAEGRIDGSDLIVSS